MKQDTKELIKCIKEAREVLKSEHMMDMQSHVLKIAEILFNNRQRTLKIKVVQ